MLQCNILTKFASNFVIIKNNIFIKLAPKSLLNQIEKSKLDAQQSADIVQLKKDVGEIKKLLEKIASK